MGFFGLFKKESKKAPFSVFIAEDNAVYLKQMEFYLKNVFGEKIQIGCFPVSEVIEVKIEHGQIPDLIIMDHNLSGKYDDASSGLAAIKKIHTEHPQIKLILHSAHTSMKDDEEFGNSKMFISIEKGEGSLEKLASTIRENMNA